MQYGALLAEGKTKRIYAHPAESELAIIVSKDDITAGDGARRNVITGKGSVSGRTTTNVFQLLRRNGIATHFVTAIDDASMVVQRCRMIPIEVVTRRFATGSYLKRFPQVSEGTRFEPPLSELFFKDDANHDPLMSVPELVAANVCDRVTLEAMQHMAQQVFLVLEKAWATHDITLVDLKVEFGYTSTGDLVLADVIDNDSWRLWPAGQKSAMLDKQVYRNMSEITPDGLAHIMQLYTQVRDYTGQWELNPALD
jgi:phosphoribosylaminoimidazole-succinocarboxamide synthase